MAVSLHSILQQAREKLSAVAGGMEALEATLLLEYATGITREQIVLEQANALTEKDINAFNALVLRRLQHEPLAYITGRKEFWSLDFLVTSDTLIPRPDSETLIEAALKQVKSRAEPTTILDIGTGSGCLLITLLTELPFASGVGVDNSERALEVASRNADVHGVSQRASFLKSHWCSAIDRTFDLIIANPPYIPEDHRATLMQDVVDFEPHTALFAGQDGLDAYREIASDLQRVMKPGAYAIFEVGQHQAQAVAELLKQQGLISEPPAHDLAGIARAVIARKPH